MTSQDSKMELEADVSQRESDRESSHTPQSRANAIGLSLRKNFSWTFTGNVVYTACQWGMVVVLAKLGSPESVGQFALGLAVTAPVIMFANLQLRIVLATDARREYLFGDYVVLRYVTTALALLFIAILAGVSGYRRETALVVLAIGTAKAFEAISDVYGGLLQQYEKMDRPAISGMIKGPLSFLALGVMFYTTRSVFWASVGLVFVWALVLIFYDMRNPRVIMEILRRSNAPDDTILEFEKSIRLHWNPKALLGLARLSVPLGFVMLLISLNANIPRYFLEHYSGERNLGIFAAMAYMMVAGTTVVSALAQSAVPRLAKYYSNGNAAAFSSLLARLAGFGGFIGCAGIAVAAVLGRWILDVFYGPEYAAHNSEFIWIAVASAVFYVQWFLGNGMTAARRFNIQVPLLATVTAATTMACYWLIPTKGLLGASFTLVISNTVLSLGTLCILAKAIALIRRGDNQPEEQK